MGYVDVRPALKCPDNLQPLPKADILIKLTYNLKDGLTDNMFKIKMEQLRNNRAGKIASRKAFTLSYICEIILTVTVRSQKSPNIQSDLLSPSRWYRTDTENSKR